MDSLITQTLIPFAGSSLVGYIVGFALKRIKWLIIIGGTILGVFFFGVYTLQAYGYIPSPGVNWDKIGNDIYDNTQHWVGGAANGSLDSSINSIIHNLGIPITSGLSIGVIAGFIRTK